MNKKILVFNIVYYLIIMLLIGHSIKDHDITSVYGFSVVIFKILVPVILGFLLFKKIIQPKSLIGKIKIFISTLLVTIIFFAIIFYIRK